MSGKAARQPKAFWKERQAHSAAAVKIVATGPSLLVARGARRGAIQALDHRVGVDLAVLFGTAIQAALQHTDARVEADHSVLQCFNVFGGCKDVLRGAQ